MLIKRSNYNELLNKIENLLEENNKNKKDLHIKLEQNKYLTADILTLATLKKSQDIKLKEYEKTILDSTTEYNNLKSSLSEEISNISAAIEETSASTEEITASVELIKERVQSAVDNAHKNTETLQNTVDKVEVLKNNAENLVISFNNINKVIAVIENVAEQTRMLGLNAAIESARVGEQGKGFAVVAREIQKLADTTKKEAEIIINTITENDKKVCEINNTANELNIEAIQLLESNSIRLENIKEINGSMEEISIAIQQVAEASTQTAVEIQRLSEDMIK